MGISTREGDRRLIEEFARVFCSAERANRVVRLAGFPPSRIPAFVAPDIFWTAIFEEIDRGLLPNHARHLVEAAYREYPHNELFKRARHELGILGALESQVIVAPRRRSLDQSWDFRATEQLLNPPGHRYPVVPIEPKCGQKSNTIINIHGSTQSSNIGWTVACVAIAAVAIVAIVAPQRTPSSEQSTKPNERDSKSIAVFARDDASEIRDRYTSKERAQGSRDADTVRPRLQPKFHKKKTKRTKHWNWEYRTYNCLVGPDETDQGRATRGETNTRGMCTASDALIFLHQRGRPTEWLKFDDGTRKLCELVRVGAHSDFVSTRIERSINYIIEPDGHKRCVITERPKPRGYLVDPFKKV